MSTWRAHIALWLLLLWGRTLLPESWVLALHGHAHTTAEPAHSPQFRRHHAPDQPLASPQHQHCGVDHFYDLPFAAAAPLRLPEPRRRAVFRRRPALAVSGLAGRPLASPPSRGPPRA